MKLRIPLSCSRYLSIFSVYVPTLQASEDIVMSFYDGLRDAIKSVPKEEELIILRDLNVRVGRQHETWDALDPYGTGKINSSGLILLELCSEFNLAICNIFFRQKQKHTFTWIHPRPKHGRMIDYIIIRKVDIRDVGNVRVLTSGECDTDHKLLRRKFKFKNLNS